MVELIMGFARVLGYIVLFIIILGIVLKIIKTKKPKSSKKLYEEEIIKRKTQAIKDGLYTFDYRGSDNMYVKYNTKPELSQDKFSTDFILRKYSSYSNTTETESDVLIDGHYYEAYRPSLLDDRHQLIITKGKEDYSNEKELKTKKAKAQKVIDDAAEEVKWAKKYAQLMGSKKPNTAAANKVKQEFEETFKKSRRLLTIADEIQDLVVEAKGIRYNN